MSIELQPLPFDYNALEPHISERAMHFHYDKDHAMYVEAANSKMSGSGLEGQDLVSIIRGKQVTRQ
jgi:Fe-Mn family superoxide dismutase